MTKVERRRKRHERCERYSQRSQKVSRFVPLKWQEEPFKDCSPVLLLTGSAGGGKSRVAAEKVHRFCLDNPGSCWLILRKAREWCSKSIVPFYFQTVVNGDPRVTYLRGQAAFLYDNGSVVYSGGMIDEKQRESIRSIGGAGGLDGVWMEEANAFSRLDFEELTGRLRHNAGNYRQIILTTNPGGPLHWIHTDLIQGGGATVYFSGARDNPTNPPDYFEALERLSGMMYQRLVLGKWVQAEGAVLKELDSTIHFIEWFPVPCEWEVYCGIDLGYINPFCYLMAALSPEEELFFFAEHYQRETLLKEHARIIFDMEHDTDMFTGDPLDMTGIPVTRYSDHARQERAELESYGIWTEPADKDVSHGIELFNRLLKPKPNGRASVYVMDTCPNLQREMQGWRYKTAKEGSEDKEQPIKVDDHAIDAARYVIMGVFGRPDHDGFSIGTSDPIKYYMKR